MRRLKVLAVLLIALPMATASQLPPPGAPPGPPPAPAPMPQAPLAAAFDTEAVSREVNAFYADYWKAWKDQAPERIAAHLASDFVGLQYAAPQGVLPLDKARAVAGLEQFFEAVRGRQTFWNRSLLAVVPRSPTEAVTAVRSEFSLREGGGETELTLELVRKGPDGRWRLVRKWSEKTPF